ncbi:MAG: aromatic ring-hydroxylating dioxygenase subunit alpha, partial [Acidimicrobiales bacterium]|nr:aromatic ring-hydroxylating dioxygenase subunit alpha [Acidimicrobiales bacterium]
MASATRAAFTSSKSPLSNRSVAFPKQYWYPVCQSKDLRRNKPVSITLMDEPLAVFRDAGGSPRAVLDRCPHRNAALSDGRVASDGNLECPYHGWRFDGTGECRAVPGLFEGASAAATARRVQSWAATERDGFVYVWAQPGSEPTREAFAMPDLLKPGRKPWQVGQVVFPCDLNATLHAALENTLDVPHTAFLHKGIFRGKRLKELTAVRRDFDGGVEVEFIGEPVGLGPIQGGPLAKKTFQHWDRFIMPMVAQVEYRVEDWLEIFNNVIHVPLSPTVTRAWFVFRWWTPLPARLIAPIVNAQGRMVLRQDKHAMAKQSANIDRFGGERFASTDLDLLGAAIWRMLRQAERAEA